MRGHLKRPLKPPLATGTSAASQPPEAPGLPDMNAETYPFEIVQALLDQAAYFNLYSYTHGDDAGAPILVSSQTGQVIGLRVNDRLYRLQVTTRVPSHVHGVGAGNVVGEPLGTFRQHWMVIPDGFFALPDREVPETVLNPQKSQRFVMLNGACRLDNGRDGFDGFGTGRTFPIVMRGKRHLLAAAVGTITRGFGRFDGFEGTYTYSGAISADEGFIGNLLCRLMDPRGVFRTERSLPNLQPDAVPHSGLTFIVFRGQKRSKKAQTRYRFGPGGQLLGFELEQELRLLNLDCASRGDDVYCNRSLGQVIGKMTSSVNLNILNPGAPGTSLSPIPFTSDNVYSFYDRDGRTIGSIAAQGGEGRSFNMSLPDAPGQQALRFGALQTLVHGTGCFSGAEGLLTDNSVVGVAPHVTSTLYTLAIYDPDGKYRATISAALA